MNLRAKIQPDNTMVIKLSVTLSGRFKLRFIPMANLLPIPSDG
jgi:hypothetical protein